MLKEVLGLPPFPRTIPSFRLQLLFVVVAAMCGCFGTNPVAATKTDNDTSTIIYTYFEHVPEELRTTGMSQQNNLDLLEYWNATWSKAGWTTRILSISDAQQHPSYDRIATILEKELHLDAFSLVLFHKWMAMEVILSLIHI